MNHRSCSGCSSGGLRSFCWPNPSRFGGSDPLLKGFFTTQRVEKYQLLHYVTCTMVEDALTLLEFECQQSSSEVLRMFQIYICVNINKHRDSLLLTTISSKFRNKQVVSTTLFFQFWKWQSQKTHHQKVGVLDGNGHRELWGASAVDIPLLSATTWATFWAALSASYCVMPPSCKCCYDGGKLGVDKKKAIKGHISKMMKYMYTVYCVLYNV